MKKTLKNSKIFIIALISVLYIGCSKDEEGEVQTQNQTDPNGYFVKAKINGEAFQATGHTMCVYTLLGNQLVIDAATTGSTKLIKIKSFQGAAVGVYTMHNTSTIIGLYQDQTNFTSYFSNDFTNSFTQADNFFEITYYDPVKKEIKGKFKFRAKNNSGTDYKDITEGSFYCYGGI